MKVSDLGGDLRSVTRITRAAAHGGGDLQVAAAHLRCHPEDRKPLPATGHRPSEQSRYDSCSRSVPTILKDELVLTLDKSGWRPSQVTGLNTGTG